MLSSLLWVLSFVLVAAVVSVPFLGPVVACGMLLMRWHWTLLANPRHLSSLRWHLPYAVLGPLAVAGSLVTSALMPRIARAAGIEWAIIDEYETYWIVIALPWAAHIVSVYAAAHEIAAKMFDFKFSLLPNHWVDIALNKNALLLPEMFMRSWGSGLLGASLAYVILSFLNHTHMVMVDFLGKFKLKNQTASELELLEIEQQRIASRQARP